MQTDYEIKQFFYSGSNLWADWPQETKLGIGINLYDARYRQKPNYTFTKDGTTYTISKEKAELYGRKYDLTKLPAPKYTKKPNIIPLCYFEAKIPTQVWHEQKTANQLF